MAKALLGQPVAADHRTELVDSGFSPCSCTGKLFIHLPICCGLGICCRPKAMFCATFCAGRGRSFETETNAAIAGRQVNALESNNTRPFRTIRPDRGFQPRNAMQEDTLPAPEAPNSPRVSDSVMKNVSREKPGVALNVYKQSFRRFEVLPSPLIPREVPSSPASPALFPLPRTQQTERESDQNSRW